MSKNDTHLFNTKERHYIKKTVSITIKSLSVLLSLGLLIIVYGAITQPHVVQKPKPHETTYPIPAGVAPIITRLGIDTAVISHIKIDTPTANEACTGKGLADPLACFVLGDTPTLTIPANTFKLSASQQNVIIAHEYLHYIWSTTSDTDKARLTPIIEQAYKNAQPYLDQRLSQYKFVFEVQGARVNELHSYIGTEIADSLISQPLLDHYKKYLPNRSALPSMYP